MGNGRWNNWYSIWLDSKKEFHQIDTLIEQLKTNPQNRRMIINLWQIPYLDTGALYPCVFNSCWDVTDGKLNCMLTIRSNDFTFRKSI